MKKKKNNLLGFRADFRIYDETERRIIEINEPLVKSYPKLKSILKDKLGLK